MPLKQNLTPQSYDSTYTGGNGLHGRDGITYDVPVVINKRVNYFIRYFQKKGEAFFKEWLKKSAKYLPMIKRILRTNNLPEDLAYLALIESGFDDRAYSKAGAAGIWQFMEETGRRYGLRIDWWMDERLDPEKSTWAAAAYLKDLYRRFDSWHLAAASYNGGEGRIIRALRKFKTDNFWVMVKKRRSLKKETRNYIPKYIAAMLIAKEPAKYGFGDINYYEPIEYDKVTVSEATDLRVIADACDCSLKEIRELNPDLLRWFTPPDYHDYMIKLPRGRRKVYLSNIKKVPKKERLNFLRHRIKKGESLHKIAKKYHTRIEPIIYLNDIKNPRLIRVGKIIVVPVRADDYKIRVKEKGVMKEGENVYLVEAGDTLWDISLRFGVKVKDLLKWNDIEVADRLFPGQRLYIRGEQT